MTKIMVIGPNIGMGGVERASVNLANEISRIGYVVFYIALIPEKPFYTLNSKVKYFEPLGFNQKKLSLIKSLMFIRNMIVSNRPDAIISFTKFYGLLANLAVLGTRYKVFISERSSPLYIWPLHIALFCKVSKFLRKPAGIIAQTTIASEYQKRYYGNIPFCVIPNALRKIELLPLQERQKNLLCVGRMGDSCKGFDLIIEAFSKLKNKDWELHFAGGTPEEGSYLIQSIKSDDILSRIKFLGKVKDIDTVYAAAGIFVLPSRSEGFPNALSEAMGAGLPCISFDIIAGPGDIIRNDVDGILVPKDDVSGLTKAIDQLIDDPEKRKYFSRNAIDSSSRFAGPIIAKSHIDFVLHGKTDIN